LDAYALAFITATLPAQAAQVSTPSPTTPDGAATSATQAPIDYVIEGGAIVAVAGERRDRVLVDERAVAVLRDGTKLYVARGPRGVAVFDVTEPRSPRPVREITVNGSATAFHVVDGQVWVVTVQRSAVPLDDASTPTQSTSSAAAPVTATAPRAASIPRPAITTSVRILHVSPGAIELAAGTRDGVRVGNRFAIFRSTVVGGGDNGGFTGEELVTIAEVVAVKETSALAETGRSAIVQMGDQARPAKGDQENKENNSEFPPRVPNVGELSVVLRPLVNTGSPLGLGVLADLEAAYWGDAYFADVRVQPLGLGWTADGAIVSTAALVEGGYDARGFAVGLGGGVSWVNGNADHMLESFGASSTDSAKGSGGPTVTESQETHAAFTLSQLARLGARDGLNLSLRNLLILHHDSSTDRSGFIYGGTTGRLSIPLGGRSDLFLEGGGGVMGYWFAGVGVASWMLGNGSPGSWKLSVSAGAAGIIGSKRVTTNYPALAPGQSAQTSSYDQSIDVAGPMVSFGLTRRF
jgi:hypothetical protein